MSSDNDSVKQIFLSSNQDFSEGSLLEYSVVSNHDDMFFACFVPPAMPAVVPLPSPHHALSLWHISTLLTYFLTSLNAVSSLENEQVNH